MSDQKKVKPYYADRLGWWQSINDEASALEAVKMSGLPVFLWGISWFVMGLVVILGLAPVGKLTGPAALFGFSVIGFGLVLIVLGLKLRKGQAKLAPIAGAIFIIGTVISSILGFMDPKAVLPILLSSLFISGLVMLLSIGGFRGWSWLKRNGKL